MQVILLSDVKKVGRKFETVNVSDGYAQGVLLPRSLAVPATPSNVKKYTAKTIQTENKKAHDHEVAENAINSVSGKSVSIQASTNETGTLFQALHKKDIADAIRKEFNVEIPELMLETDAIKKVGEYKVAFSGNKKRSVTIKVT